jgi:hypothetical protein
MAWTTCVLKGKENSSSATIPHLWKRKRDSDTYSNTQPTTFDVVIGHKTAQKGSMVSHFGTNFLQSTTRTASPQLHNCSTLPPSFSKQFFVCMHIITISRTDCCHFSRNLSIMAPPHGEFQHFLHNLFMLYISKFHSCIPSVLLNECLINLVHNSNNLMHKQNYLPHISLGTVWRWHIISAETYNLA